MVREAGKAKEEAADGVTVAKEGDKKSEKRVNIVLESIQYSIGDTPLCQKKSVDSHMEGVEAPLRRVSQVWVVARVEYVPE